MPKKIEGSSDNWMTPRDFWLHLHSQYGFDIDLCSVEKDAKTERFVSNLAEFKPDKYFGCAWINPPFSKARKLIPIALGFDFPVVGIYRCDNQETEVWQNVIFQKADWVFYLRGRVRYEDPFGTRQSPMFPSALWGKGVPPPTGLEGVCLKKA